MVRKSAGYRHLVLVVVGAVSWVTQAQANVVGTDAQSFNPITSGLDFVTVQSSETLRPGYLNLGLFANLATNTLPRYRGINPDYNDRLAGTDLNLGLGLLPRWDIGVSAPAIIYQSIHNPGGFSGRFAEKGFTEIRVNTKYRFVGDDSQGVAAVLSSNFNLTQDNPYVGLDGGPSYNAELVGDRTFGRFAVALNVGHRWRRAGIPYVTPPIDPYRNQWIASTAANYHLPKIDSKFVLELFGSTPSQRSGGVRDRQQSSLEVLGAIKHDWTQNFSGVFGLGRGLLQGVASPDFRVFIGMNLAMGPLFGREKEPQKLVEEQVVVQGEPEAVASQPEAVERFVTRQIRFDFNSADLQEESQRILSELADQLKKKPFKRLVIEGHTDSVGDDEYNQHLSELRAQAIRDALISGFKIPAAKVTAIGYGESKPIADNGNFQGRALNRRVEFQIER